MPGNTVLAHLDFYNTFLFFFFFLYDRIPNRKQYISSIILLLFGTKVILCVTYMSDCLEKIVLHHRRLKQKQKKKVKKNFTQFILRVVRLYCPAAAGNYRNICKNEVLIQIV